MKTSSIVWIVVAVAVVALGGWYLISMSSGQAGTSSSPSSAGSSSAPAY